MNTFQGSYTASHGVYEYEAMWSVCGRRVFWDGRVTRNGAIVGNPGGFIADTSEADARALITAALHDAIDGGLRRQNERIA